MDNEQVAHDLTMYVINHATDVSINDVKNVKDCSVLYPDDLAKFYMKNYKEILDTLNADCQV